MKFWYNNKRLLKSVMWGKWRFIEKKRIKIIKQIMSAKLDHRIERKNISNIIWASAATRSCWSTHRSYKKVGLQAFVIDEFIFTNFLYDIVSVLTGFVSNERGANVGHNLAQLSHACILLSLNFHHTLLSLGHEQHLLFLVLLLSCEWGRASERQ